MYILVPMPYLFFGAGSGSSDGYTLYGSSMASGCGGHWGGGGQPAWGQQCQQWRGGTLHEGSIVSGRGGGGGKFDGGHVGM